MGSSTCGVSLLGEFTNVETGKAFIRVAGYGLRRAQACSGLRVSLSPLASLSRGRITGIRSWIDASSSLGVVVMMAHDATGSQPSVIWGPLSPSAANQTPVIWDPDMEEADEEPPYLILHNEYFTVYKHRRRKLLSGQPPPALDARRGISGRTWQAYQRRLSQEPPWERAWRYRLMLSQQGIKSIRVLASALQEDHSRVARVLQILKLPERVLAALRAHAGHPRIRAHFTEKRLRQLVKERWPEAEILREIEQVVQGRS